MNFPHQYPLHYDNYVPNAFNPMPPIPLPVMYPPMVPIVLPHHGYNPHLPIPPQNPMLVGHRPNFYNHSKLQRPNLKAINSKPVESTPSTVTKTTSVAVSNKTEVASKETNISSLKKTEAVTPSTSPQDDKPINTPLWWISEIDTISGYRRKAMNKYYRTKKEEDKDAFRKLKLLERRSKKLARQYYMLHSGDCEQTTNESNSKTESGNKKSFWS